MTYIDITQLEKAKPGNGEILNHSIFIRRDSEDLVLG